MRRGIQLKSEAVDIDREITGGISDFYSLCPRSLLIQQTFKCQIQTCLGEGMCSMSPCHIHLTPMNVKSRHAAELNVIHTTESFPMRREAGGKASPEDVSSPSKPLSAGPAAVLSH